MRTLSRAILWQFALWGVILFSCSRNYWDDYYALSDEHANMKLWDAVRENPDYSEFVDYINKLEIDTIFEKDQAYTLFVPGNKAFEDFIPREGFLEQTLLHHISRTVYIPESMGNYKKLQMLSGKFVEIVRSGNDVLFDSIPIIYESPLYLDGKYYEIQHVANPRPNLYEFTSLYSSVIKDYIDSQDSVYLDRNESTPIGFDKDGNTLYDSVFGNVNLFEKYFFPVSREFRDRSATFLIFTQEQYTEALNMMALNLGGDYHTYQDIPREWQFEVFLPKILADGMFADNLPYEEFMKGTLLNIQGDSVTLDYQNIDPNSRFICSNGVIYRYSDFVVPDTLYLGHATVEGEDLIDSIAPSEFVFKPEVKVSGELITPLKTYVVDASGGIVISVPFKRNYSGKFNLEVVFGNIFPGRYVLEWRASYRPGGVFAISVNNEEIAEFDTYAMRSNIQSVTGELYRPVNGYNIKDFWVDNIAQFGDVVVKFEYLRSGTESNSGFSMDYIRLIPAFE